MQFEDFAALVQTRRSIRKWQDRDVPDEMLMRAIDLATWAPNGGNFQPWRFWIIKNREIIHQMADAVVERSRIMASWPEAEPYQQHADRWVRVSGFFRDAPACIAVLVGGYQSTADKLLLARGSDDPVAREMFEWRNEGSSRLQTIAGAVMTMLLALHQQGLGACWMAGPQQARGDIEKLLDVPPEWEFAALVPVGFPAEEPTGGARKALSEVVRIIR